MIKQLLLGLVLLLPSISMGAPRPFVVDLAQWCGINELDDSAKISQCEAQDAENVLTDGGRLEKFPGAIEILDAVLTGFSVGNYGQFVDQGGSKYAVFHASESVYYTDFGGSPTWINNTAANVGVDMASCHGRIYFADGTNAIWWWDGTSTGTYSGSPIVKYIECAHTRLFGANTSASDSRLSISSAGAATYWTTSLESVRNDEAPFVSDFYPGDGEGITCLKETPYGVFVGKRSSVHILRGNGNLTWVRRLIASGIGCLDDRSVQVIPGIGVVWAGYYAAYAWTGGAEIPKPISLDVYDSYKSFRQRNAQRDSWSVSEQAQWEQGVATTNGAETWSTDIYPAAITPATWYQTLTSSSDFAAGTFDYIGVSTGGFIHLATHSALTTNGNFESGSATPWTLQTAQGGFTCGAGGLSNSVSGTSPIEGTYSGLMVIDRCLDTGGGCAFLGSSQAKWVLQDGNGSDISNTTEFSQTNATVTVTLAGYSTNYMRIVISHNTSDETAHYAKSFSPYFTLGGLVNQLTFQAKFDTSGLGPCGSRSSMWIDNLQINGQYVASGTYTSAPMNTYFSQPVGGVFSSTFTSGGGTHLHFDWRSATSTSGAWNAWTATTDTLRLGATQQVIQVRARLHSSSNWLTPTLQDLTAQVISTGIYRSPVRFVGTDITSHLTLNFEEVASRTGLATYRFRTSNSIFAEDAASPSWNSVTNHQIPSIATGSYVQYDVRSYPGSSSDSLKITSSLYEWNEGEAPAMASMLHDGRYWVCGASGSSATINTLCLVLQRNGRWTKFTSTSIATLGFYDGDPIAGSGDTDSAVWRLMDEDVKNFSGQPIRAFWETGDMRQFGQEISVNSNKTLREIWIDADYEAGADVDVGYAVNKSTSYTTTAVELDTEASWVNERIHLEDGFAVGRYIRLRLSNDDADERASINNLTIYGDVEERYQ